MAYIGISTSAISRFLFVHIMPYGKCVARGEHHWNTYYSEWVSERKTETTSTTTTRSKKWKKNKKSLFIKWNNQSNGTNSGKFECKCDASCHKTHNIATTTTTTTVGHEHANTGASNEFSLTAFFEITFGLSFHFPFCSRILNVLLSVSLPFAVARQKHGRFSFSFFFGSLELSCLTRWRPVGHICTPERLTQSRLFYFVGYLLIDYDFLSFLRSCAHTILITHHITSASNSDGSNSSPMTTERAMNREISFPLTTATNATLFMPQNRTFAPNSIYRLIHSRYRKSQKDSTHVFCFHASIVLCRSICVFWKHENAQPKKRKIFRVYDGIAQHPSAYEIGVH